MKKVYSNYSGGFVLLIVVNILIGFLTFKLLTDSKISLDKVDFINDSDAILLYSVICGLNLLTLISFTTQCKFIIVDNNGITFINPLIPILRKTMQWSDFDYYILVDEAFKNDTHEAVWLIKDQKIKGRFSSFYYTNYTKLKRQIKTNGNGKKYYGPIRQLLTILGLIKIKI